MRGRAVFRTTCRLKDEEEGTGTQKNKTCIVKMGGRVV